MSQSDLFGAPEIGPPGLRYQADLIDAAEEAALAAGFATLPFGAFEFHGHLGNRRVVSFGYRYDFAREQAVAAADIPDFLRPLRAKAAEFAGLSPDDFRQALVTEYAPGAGIGWHRDKAVFGKVVGVSLLAPCVMRFRRRDGATWQRRAVPLAPRSAYLLDGQARRIWEHSITPQDQLRYSVTFRTLA